MLEIPHTKNILIMGSPRSGTHALGSHISRKYDLVNLAEICITDGVVDPVQDVSRMFDTNQRQVAHIVQMTSKIRISHLVYEIKKHCWLVTLRRRDKIQQFASWMYFHKSGGVLRQWHNHLSSEMAMAPKSIIVSQEEIEQFLLEQMIDDFFQPDQIIYYEDLDLSKSTIKKNQYAWDLPLIFANLDFVQEKLQSWRYNE